MKKILTCFLLVMVVLSQSAFVFAERSDNTVTTERESQNVVCDFDDAYEKLIWFMSNDESYRGYSIVSHEKVYDVDLVPYGIAFDLLGPNGQKGYAVVVDIAYECFVFEISLESESPFKQRPYGSLPVYDGPFCYLYTDKQTAEKTTKTDNLIFVQIRDGKVMDVQNNKHYVHISDIRSETEPGPIRTNYYYFLSSVGNFPNQTQQPYSYGCIPASMSMCLYYLHYTNQITINSYYADTQSIYNYLRPLMVNAAGTYCPANKVVTGLNSFSSNLTNRTFWTSDNDFQPDTYFSVAKDEIDNNCPLVVVFYGSGGQSTNHARAMKGYALYSDGSNHAVVVDPWNSTPITTTVIWTSSTVFGYFLFYLGAWH